MQWRHQRICTDISGSEKIQRPSNRSNKLKQHESKDIALEARVETGTEETNLVEKMNLPIIDGDIASKQRSRPSSRTSNNNDEIQEPKI